MTILLIGLVIFLGVHSARIVADGWRSAQIARIGPGVWKLGYTVLSLIGFYLVLWGYDAARQAPVVLWTPPVIMQRGASRLTLVAFVLLAATYVPRNDFKARLHHPMLVSVQLWAVAHLLANGTLADVLLFGSFLVWAVLSFLAARQRDRAAGTRYPAGSLTATLATVAVGCVAWALFAFWLHGWLIGVRPFY
jgi:uncharacterized membrane protein